MFVQTYLANKPDSDSDSDVAYLEIIGFVVMCIQCSEELGVPVYCDVPHEGHPVHHGLPRKLLHLDVVELAEVTEPLYQLRCDAPGELRRRWKNDW